MKKLIALLLSLVLMLTFAACQAAETPQATDSVGNATDSVGDASDATATADPDATGDTQTAGMKKILVTVVHSDGTSKEFTYETAEEFLGPVLVAEGLIQGNDGPYGLEITQVDGETAVYNTDKAYWALYEGDAYALQGIDTTPVTDGGSYKLEYTRG